MLCIHCEVEIPPARLEALPETRTCVNCSDVQPYKAIISGSAKSKNFEVQVVKADDPSLDYHDDNRWGKVSETDD
jgi:RNA polymerase-binding transcription factor DksA